MTQANPVGTTRMVIHDGTYRVVVFRNSSPAHDDDTVHAHCIEQSLVGRGSDVPSALQDLATTMSELIAMEYEEAQPEYEPNPDPELVAAFERKIDELDGLVVIRRGVLRIRLERASKNKQPELRLQEFTFTPAYAATA